MCPEPGTAELAGLYADHPLRFRWADLASLGAPAAGSGQLRSEPEDFYVQEIPAYLPSGEGEHLYLHIKKRGLTSAAVRRELARQLRVKEKDIGMAGQKDRHAVTEQWFSLPAKAEARLEHFALPGAEVLQAARHGNKLGLGHLRGNRFRLQVRRVSLAETEQAAAALERLAQSGLPNYFGPQRFGLGGLNAVGGLHLLRGSQRISDPALRRFLLSALQSAVFNRALSLRIEKGLFAAVLPGDYAQKSSTGGVFVVEDAAAELPRARSGEISALGTLYGRKTAPPTGEAGRLEAQALADLGLAAEELTALRGDRRATRVFFLEPPTLTAEEDGYTVTFALPKGSFATAALRELIGGEIDTLPLPEGATMPF